VPRSPLSAKPSPLTVGDNEPQLLRAELTALQRSALRRQVFPACANAPGLSGGIKFVSGL
jgi:hypothetical protein